MKTFKVLPLLFRLLFRSQLEIWDFITHLLHFLVSMLGLFACQLLHLGEGVMKHLKRFIYILQIENMKILFCCASDPPPKKKRQRGSSSANTGAYCD